MYAAHFGLTERPFSLAPDPRYLYLSDAHREALAHLLYRVGGGGSVVQLTGEVGTGKTTVCRALLEQVPPDVDVAMIFNPRLTSVELLAVVCDELRVAYPAGTTSLKVLVDALSQALLEAHGRGRRTVLIIDEAQNLSAEVLEEVRLLTNLETTREKLLQVILIGQPELAEILARPDLRQLAQRVTARYHLRPFTEEETRAYVQHRMEVAGQRQPIFDTGAVRVAHRLSHGIPRRLNTICDRALLGAYATGRTRVSAAIVRQAALEVLGRRPRSRRLVTATAIAAVLAGAGGALSVLGPSSLPRLGSLALRGGVANSAPAAPTAPVVALAATPVRQVFGSVDRPVENIAYDSRRVQRHTMFVALRGEKADGHQFIGNAIDKGASVIVADREEKDPRVTCLIVETTRTALADFSAAFYGHPARKLKLAAVTGTNGKTTTTFLIKRICENSGLRCGLIGTVRYEIGERILPAIRTTPESLDLQELLAQIANAGCKAAAMEVSSHALAQERARGLEWNVAVFTNLTQDHLDFHGTMESYFDSKVKLFTQLAHQPT